MHWKQSGSCSMNLGCSKHNQMSCPLVKGARRSFSSDTSDEEPPGGATNWPLLTPSHWKLPFVKVSVGSLHKLSSCNQQTSADREELRTNVFATTAAYSPLLGACTAAYSLLLAALLPTCYAAYIAWCTAAHYLHYLPTTCTACPLLALLASGVHLRSGVFHGVCDMLR